ncbi:glycosyltransferase [Flavobacterium sp. 83]|uniref:glycosyltransferase n=1 Tax=Flavobacterium sp. 83 TaxID=1131812 RepID=UPI0005503FC9|nr:glycosyltransferase [Flavobacterium sp. 83]
MKFTIFTHVPHSKEDHLYYAYAPYVREMNVWGKSVDELAIVAPFFLDKKTAIDSSYDHQRIEFISVPNFDILSIKSTFGTILKLPSLLFVLFKAMQSTDHIHIRCPGNIGLLACLVQIFFPKKNKTAKYAGNWDPQAKQPWTYKLQKWILSNTFLTRNMHVLVYGGWEGMSKNIKPFFTATYFEKDKLALINKKVLGIIHFVFVGTLVIGKNPFYAIQLVQFLFEKGYNVQLDIYGDGIEKNKLIQFVIDNKLEEIVSLKGNQTQETIKRAYQESHFVILPSESEGWPKVIAEGMFWGCVPIATAVSCVPYMLDYGKRGILIDLNLEKDCNQIEDILQDQNYFDTIQNMAASWSRKYTLDVFEAEIKHLLTS